jgi:tyrosinase
MENGKSQRKGGVTRRVVVAGGAALASLPIALTSGAIAQANSPRQSVTGAGAAALASYKKAIRAMLALPPTDPRNWYRQALIHMLDCPHANWWFLPWHRGYLANFESICRQLSGDPTFSVPFWDWTDKPEVPADFFQDVLDPTNTGFADNGPALRDNFGSAIDAFYAGLSSSQSAQLALRGMSDADVLWRQVLNAMPARSDSRGLTAQNPNMPFSSQREVALNNVLLALKPQSFGTFGSREAPNHHQEIGKDSLERGPHDNVHGGVNGLMGAFMSPVDPLFWLHHCNLDRLWTLWATKESKAGRSGLPENVQAWRNEPFLFLVDAEGQAVNRTAGDYIDNTGLGVTYGPGMADEVVPTSASPVVAASEVRTFTGERADKVLRVNSEVSLSAQIPSSVFAGVQNSPVAEETPTLMAYVTVKTPTEARTSALRVFMNCPYLSSETPDTDPHYVGRIRFFGADHGMAHQNQDITYALPLNSTLAALPRDRSNRSGIKLQIIAECKERKRRVLDGAVKALEIKTV